MRGYEVPRSTLVLLLVVALVLLFLAVVSYWSYCEISDLKHLLHDALPQEEIDFVRDYSASLGVFVGRCALS